MASPTHPPRFLVAKYAPDLDRMEPRNIGVILWAKGSLSAQFLDESEASKFVTEMDVYARWVKYWNASIEAKLIEPRRREPVPTSDPACLDAMIETQKGNYILTDAGELMQQIRKKDSSAALKFLFRQLVSTKTKRDPHQGAKGFANRCLSLLGKAGVSDRDDFKQKFPVDCSVFGVVQNIHFSYGIGNGHPEALWQRVQLDVEQSVTSSAAKLHSLIYASSVLPKNRCRALIRKSDVNTKAAQEGYKMLEQICPVIDVDSPDADAAMIESLAPNMRG